MRWLIAVVGVAMTATAARGQQAAPDSCARPDSTGRAAVRLEAVVRADSLRVGAPGAATATATPCGIGQVRVDRGTLPERLVPGTTYRNVTVRVVIEGDPVLACRLAAALADNAAGLAALCRPEP